MIQFGMVTYQWGSEWDLPTLINYCAEAGFGGVELRTTHKHGVEVTLSKAERSDVKKRFADSPVKCLGPGSACEFHSVDHGVVSQNIELTKKFVELSSDIGGTGVKVRPNGFAKGEDRDKTIERIGLSLRECGKFADGFKQQIRLEVHGTGTKEPAVIKQIMDVADHPAVVVCWNSNPGETIDGSLKHNFELLKGKLGGTVHINNLHDPKYPYRELFRLLNEIKYDGFCLSECGYSLSECTKTTVPVQLMRYYKALFEELSKPA